MRPLSLAVVAALALLLPAPALAQEAGTGAKVYKQTVPSVVWVHSKRARGLATGSGTLIDRDRRLVLTNYHVVEDNPGAVVFFPYFRGGHPVAEKQFYLDRKNRLGRAGRVVAVDKQADLALIQLGSVPDDAKGVPLAPASPDPGDPVQSIGNTGKSGALWGFVRGTVRQVYQKTWKAELEPGRILTFRARVIETDSPTNPGDSGGPLLNDKAQLVGVTQGGALNAQLVSTFVDVSEVKKLLATRVVRQLKGSRPAAAPAERRNTPPTVADKARVFSPQAVQSAEQSVEELFKKGLDVLIETYPAAPADWREQAKEAKPAERQKLFRKWATERLRGEKAHGIIVLICLDPKYVTVEIESAVKKQFPDQFAKRLGDVLLKALRDKKPDEGLAEVLKLVRAEYKGEKK
jgi:S1-C subfamily serine protease